MTKYLVAARLLSREAETLAEIQAHLDAESNTDFLIKKKFEEGDTSSSAIHVLNLTWRNARKLEKHLNLPGVFVAPQIPNGQFKLKLVVPLMPDEEAITKGLESWATSRNFCPRKTNFFLRQKRDRTIACLESERDAEALNSLLAPFCEKSFVATFSAFPILRRGLTPVWGLLLLSYVPKILFLMTLMWVLMAVFSAVFCLVYPFFCFPIFMEKKESTKFS